MNNFRIEIINKEEVKELFKHWGRFSCKCYNTPIKYAEKVGKSCLETGHFSGSRSRYIEFDVTNVPRALVDQLVRKEIGCAKNVASGRYIDYSNFTYYTPPILKAVPKALAIYEEHMEITKTNYKKMSEILSENGITGEKNFEICRGISPMNYNTGLCIGFTIESFIDVCHERLCVCAQEHIRRLVKMMRDEVVKLLPELEGHLVAKCDALLYCPESAKRSCGRHIQKDELKLIIQEHKEKQTKKKKIEEIKKWL